MTVEVTDIVAPYPWFDPSVEISAFSNGYTSYLT